MNSSLLCYSRHALSAMYPGVKGPSIDRPGCFPAEYVESYVDVTPRRH
jgi:hypothetical protein